MCIRQIAVVQRLFGASVHLGHGWREDRLGLYFIIVAFQHRFFLRRYIALGSVCFLIFLPADFLCASMVSNLMVFVLSVLS